MQLSWYVSLIPTGVVYYFLMKTMKSSKGFRKGTISEGIHADGDLDTHYSVYVYARQQGNWIDLFYEGREKFFYLDYTLRACDKLPCPLFCAHSTGDTDVPFSEFTELSNKYHAKRFIVSGTEHDFDRDTENPFTQKVLDETVAFIEKCSNK